MELVRHAGRGEGGVQVVDIGRRRVLVLVPEEPQDRAPDAVRQPDQRHAARPHAGLDAPAIQHDRRLELRHVAGAEPAQPPAPAMADHPDAVLVDLLVAGQQLEGRLEVRDRPIVAEPLALDLDVRLFRPPVEEMRHGHGIAGACEALSDVDLEGVGFEPGMGDRDMLRDDQTGKRPLALRLEDEHVHRTAVHFDNAFRVHARLLRCCR